MGYKGTIFMLILVLLPPSITVSIVTYIRFENTSLTLLTLAGLAYAFVLSRIVRPYFTSPLRHLPTPSGERFFWGNAGRIFVRPPGVGMLQVAKEVPNDGIIMFRGVLHRGPSLLLTTPQTVMEVLNTHSYDWEKPSPARRFLARVLGEGLILVEGQQHKMQRKAVAPAFSGRNIKDLVPLFWQKSRDFTNAVEIEISRDPVLEIGQIISRVTLDIIGAACIGKDFNTLQNPDEELATLYAWITDIQNGSMLTYAVLNIVLGPWIVDHLPWSFSRRVLETQGRLRQLVKELLDEKKVAKEQKTAESKDIISIIMRSGDFTDDYLTDQLLTFLAAGHETTASAMIWACYMLSLHPEAQKKLREECAAHLSLAQDVDADTVDNLPYLNAVIHEVLRFYPTVPATARVACRQTQIGKYVISKGTSAMVSPWMLNRLPSIWGDDAEEFNPERWIDGRVSATGEANNPYSFITFLYGPRSCIGQTFARYEFKCLLAAFVMRFQFEMQNPNEEVKPEGVITIKPRDGLRLIVKPVKS